VEVVAGPDLVAEEADNTTNQ
jgi:hypothetical protein